MSLYIFICFTLITQFLCEIEDFVSDCMSPGTDSMPLTTNECILSGVVTGSLNRCCFATGQVLLDTKQICITVNDYQDIEKRVAVINELNQYATAVKLDCGVPRVLPQTCSLDHPEPTSASECTEAETGNDETDCCYVSIKSEDYNGTSCIEFPHLDINTIGEAVVAAKTINATLVVNCDGNYYQCWILGMIAMIMMIIL